MPSRWRQLLLLAATTSFLSIGGCDTRAGAGSAPDQPPAAASDSDADRPIERYRIELLDLAFGAATAIPVQPHINDRSRAQASVVDACFELDQPRRALEYLKQIGNWRRGNAYADLAFYCAQRGYTEQAQVYVGLAEQAAMAEAGDEWRRDRIMVNVARTLAWLGQDQQAAQYETDVVPSETGKVDGVRAMLIDEEQFDRQIEAVLEAAKQGNFDVTTNVLTSCTELFDRFYDDLDRRTRAEETIKSSWEPVSYIVRFNLLIRLAEIALDHEDPARAISLAEESAEFIETRNWTPDFEVQLISRLAVIQSRAGDSEGAVRGLEHACEVYRNGVERILTVKRAGALRFIAEGFHALGDRDAALDYYTQAHEEGARNPNQRPRALDFTATTVSMALFAFEPDEALWARLREVREGLDLP